MFSSQPVRLLKYSLVVLAQKGKEGILRRRREEMQAPRVEAREEHEGHSR